MVGVSVVAHSQASAQSTAAKKAEANKRYAQGVAYLKTHSYAEAVTEFEAGYKLTYKAGFLFNAGRAYELWGKKEKALAKYRRYLTLAPRGRASVEARARAAALQKIVMKEREARAAALAREVDQQKRKKRAVELAASATRRFTAKDYGKAIEEFRAAFTLVPQSSHIYFIAESYRLLGNRPQAIIEYRHYGSLAPAGPHAADSLQKIATLQRELVDAAKPKPKPKPKPDVKPLPRTDLVPAEQPTISKKPSKKTGIAWKWIGVGAAALAAGLATDLIPDSAGNHKLDPLDFAPAALYGAASVFVFIGVF